MSRNKKIVIFCGSSILVVIVCIIIFFSLKETSEDRSDKHTRNYNFPKEFVFGSASASYQVEGGWNEDGKGENIYDYTTHNMPERYLNGATGDIASDSYHKYKEDIRLLKELGVHFYRFSISWSRILPTGKKDNINQAGIDYYNNIISGLIANNIEPYVTIYHWDLPLPLHEEGGWLNRRLADYYVDYAKILFDHFGDRVKTWMTFNEIYHICEFGYSVEYRPPYLNMTGVGGYECSHTVLLAHGRTYRMYKEMYQSTQKGRIGAVVDTFWFEPASNSRADRDASERDLQMNFGWYADPLIYGNYPKFMIDRIRNISFAEGYQKSRLPEFTIEEQAMLKGSIDFLGLNHYTTYLVTPSYTDDQHPSHFRDVDSVRSQDPAWKHSGADWHRVVPWGFRKLLNWIKNRYDNYPTLITESGYPDPPIDDLEDHNRIEYYRLYLEELLKAMHEDGCNVIGYTTWSLLDSFEWMEGYTQRFGLHHVNFSDPQRPRTPKLSALIYKNIIETRRIDWDYNPSLTTTH